MRYPTVMRSLAPTAAAAILGNVLVRREDLIWFDGLRAPRFQLPMRGFLVVGASYYLSIGTVVHRSFLAGDRAAYRLSLVVLAGNEVWNYFFFARRSTRAGFLGVLVYTAPVCLLQATLIRDRLSALAFAPYTAWLIGYDVPWTYRLWRLNP
jgi:benzodiazapine receptor